MISSGVGTLSKRRLCDPWSMRNVSLLETVYAGIKSPGLCTRSKTGHDPTHQPSKYQLSAHSLFQCACCVHMCEGSAVLGYEAGGPGLYRLHFCEVEIVTSYLPYSYLTANTLSGDAGLGITASSLMPAYMLWIRESD